MMLRFVLSVSIWCLLSLSNVFAQPQVCGDNPAMTSFCADACVICDIDGFTGNNNLTATGQGFPGFCTTQYNNMQYIAFIAGTVNLTISVDVGDCVGGLSSLEVGFFQSLDCENFTAITDCDTDIPENTTQVFTNIVPLTIGQYYYLVIDGSSSANCDWTFNVDEGSTEVLPLEDSGVLTNSPTSCPQVPINFNTSGEVGAADYTWEVEGEVQAGNGLDFTFQFPEDGTYEVCVTASNVCDEAAPTCTTVEIITPGTLILDEILCFGDCIEINGVEYCDNGFFEEIVTLPNGCDSLIQLDLEVLNQPSLSLDLWICNDESYTVGSSVYNATGSYTDTVLTDDDCDSLVFLELLVIECEISGQSSEIPVLCAGTATGTLVFSIDQGTAPFDYTYTNIADGSITGTGTTNLLTDNEIPSIPVGTYQIYITDGFGNDGVLLQEVTEPLALAVSIDASDYNGFNVSCFSNLSDPGDDGSLTANVNFGTPPYTYLWSDGQMNPTALGLQAQNYTVTITDANECTIEQSFLLTSPPPIQAIVEFIDPSCDGENTGVVLVDTVIGGIPDYQYALDTMIFGNSSQFSGLSEGDYELFVEDENGCVEIVSGTLTAADIPEINIYADTLICLGDSILLEPILFVDFLSSIAWDNSITLSCLDCLEPFARPFDTETYTIFATSTDGCVDSTSVVVRVDKKRRVFFPNVISPNDDGLNDLFYPFGAQEVEEVINFDVYDRWGDHVYEAENFPHSDSSYGWDGTLNNQKVQAGVFAWTANVLFLDGEVISYYGTVTVIR